MAEKIMMEIGETDMVELREWATNSEQSVEALLQEALLLYMSAVRADHADLDRRGEGPFYEHEDAMAILAERRRRRRSEAAE
jgi:hypothetical protein